VVIASIAAGCGGGSSARTGRATFSVNWPIPTRVIPAASQSIKITLTNAGGFHSQKLTARPAQGGTASVTFFDIPVGLMTATAVAYPNSDGTGTAQAQGSVVFTVVANEVAVVNLTMSSTIAGLELNPANPSVAVGGTTPLIVTARNQADEVVLVTPRQFQWQSLNESKATVSQTGVVTGVGAGTAPIRVTDSESGRTVSVDVRVMGPGQSGRGLADSPWPKWGRDLSNTARGVGSGATGAVRWTFAAPPSNYSSPVIGPDDTVYYGSSDGKLYALDGASGVKKWEFATGSAIDWSPMVQASGLVLFGNRAGSAYAVEASTGNVRWQTSLGANTSVAAATISSDGTAVFTTRNAVVALDAETGDNRWSTPISLTTAIPNVALAADGTLYVPAVGSRSLYFLDIATGQERRPPFGGSDVEPGIVIRSDGLVYVGLNTDLHLYNPSTQALTTLIHATESFERFGRWLALGSDETLYAATVIDGAGPGPAHLFAFRNGVQWMRAATSFRFTDPVVDSAGTVFVGYLTGGTQNPVVLTAINGSNGLTRWQSNIELRTRPAIGRDGTLYFSNATSLIAVR